MDALVIRAVRCCGARTLAVECNTSRANVCLHARKFYGCTDHPRNKMLLCADVGCGM
jgi:hypothetical protein